MDCGVDPLCESDCGSCSPGNCWDSAHSLGSVSEDRPLDAEGSIDQPTGGETCNEPGTVWLRFLAMQSSVLHIDLTWESEQDSIFLLAYLVDAYEAGEFMGWDIEGASPAALQVPGAAGYPYLLRLVKSGESTSPTAFHLHVRAEAIPEELDPDRDGICSDGDSSGSTIDNPCTGGAFESCDDNCQGQANPSQRDIDGDSEGDPCDLDDDADGVLDSEDNCPQVPNPEQTDSNGSGLGDACEVDWDNDGLEDWEDNCRNTPNPDQEDSDGDEVGDACDNCIDVHNPGQYDIDEDEQGDACDEDDDGDGIVETDDNCPKTHNPDQEDSDGDGKGDVCDFPEMVEQEPNDSSETANDIFLAGGETVTLRGDLHTVVNDGSYSGDRDMFRFIPENDGTLSYDLDWLSEESDYDIILLDIDGQSVDGFQGTTDGRPEQVTGIPVVASESYFLTVVGFLGEAGEYWSRVRYDAD
ncbi:MAG: thrombospondin type 3 repeat-containing protein [Deltaproteobacteria bacterium]|nr:thrombospondin type 3 repeat-containing protein [Deltaproteobacteria bacterium]